MRNGPAKIECDNGPVPYETLRFDFPPVRNTARALSFHCSPVKNRPHQCTGKTWPNRKCECDCHGIKGV